MTVSVVQQHQSEVGPNLRAGVVVTAIRAADRFVRWLFGPDQPWMHLYLGAISLGWSTVMVLNAELFVRNRLGYGAMDILGDRAWIAIFVGSGLLHGAGLLRPGWTGLRAIACFASAWTWLFVSFSFARTNGFTPGTVIYGQLGLLAAFAGLRAAWQGRARV